MKSSSRQSMTVRAAIRLGSLQVDQTWKLSNGLSAAAYRYKDPQLDKHGWALCTNAFMSDFRPPDAIGSIVYSCLEHMTLHAAFDEEMSREDTLFTSLTAYYMLDGARMVACDYDVPGPIASFVFTHLRPLSPNSAHSRIILTCVHM